MTATAMVQDDEDDEGVEVDTAEFAETDGACELDSTAPDDPVDTDGPGSRLACGVVEEAA